MRRIAVVTGGGRGIGFAAAQALAREGFSVLITGRNAETLESAVERLAGEGHQAEFLEMDVTSPSSITSAAETVADRFGRIDVLINNAGILPEATSDGEHAFIDLDAFTRTFETNVVGVAAVTEAFLPLLMQSTSARIVNVSSRMGSLNDQQDITSPYYGSVVPAYQASKAAVNSLTIALSKKLSDTDVKVTSVCPGWVQTDLAPGNREQAPTTADEAARVLLAAATLPDDAPSGSFMSENGPVPW